MPDEAGASSLVELARRTVEAQNAGDIDALIGLYMPEAVWDAVGYGLACQALSQAFAGLEGLRYLWLEWLTPWASYRSEIDDMIDLGDAVLVLVRDFGRRAEETAEVAVTSAAVWTVRDGKIAQITFWADRPTALKAVGLED